MDSQAGSRKTYLSRLHPYPAMVADDLAVQLAERYVAPGSSLLDPFCGTGRILAASPHAGQRTGLDVNPLGWLLTSAKFARVKAPSFKKIFDDLGVLDQARPEIRLQTAINGGVEWFSPAAALELERIISRLNSLRLDEPELLLVGAVLSATAREVSFARQNGWKLHRRSAQDRATLDVNPAEVFRRRLRYCLRNIQNGVPSDAQDAVYLFDARNLALPPPHLREQFDVVITSPPYGDSRTTVQYGAASGLCLSVVSHLKGLEKLKMKGNDIDNVCLGGRTGNRNFLGSVDLSQFWGGTADHKLALLVGKFVGDYCEAIAGISNTLRSSGKAILIVGRRTVGGNVLALDHLSDVIARHSGLELRERHVRSFEKKRTPRLVNRFGRSTDPITKASGLVHTMNEEIILVFEKQRPVHDGGTKLRNVVQALLD